MSKKNKIHNITKRHKKIAQTATEYLIILAVVIVVALIVVSAMGGIPGIGKSGQDKADKIFWTSNAEIAIPKFANTNSSGMVASIRNNLREGITIMSFSLDGVDLLNAPAGVFADSGDTADLPLNAALVPGCVAGTGFSYNVEINYSTIVTSQVYTYNGYGRKLADLCGN